MASNPLETEQNEEALGKAQIARRLGLGFVVIAVLLGILLMADNQFLGGGDSAVLAPSPEPAASHRTIRTPENRDNPPAPAQPEVADAPPANAPAAGGQVTPMTGTGTEPPAAAPEAAREEPPAHPVKGAGRSGPGGHPVARSAKPVPGVIPTTPLKTAPPAPVPVTVEPRKAAAPKILANGYVLQAGVFSNPQKAEELHALLTLNGIPSTLETRVHVGPFANKTEADAARAKLKGLGIESLLLPPRK